MKTHIRIFSINLIIIAGFLGIACTTRVSEWILLNILPEQYLLVYFHGNNPSSEIMKQNDIFAGNFNLANIHYNSIKKDNLEKPYYALYYRNKLFSTYNNLNELAGLTFSPLRKKVADELMEGKVCVMLYLKCDNKEKDDKGFRILQNALEKSPFKDIITVFELSRTSKEEAHFASLLLNVEDDLKDIMEPMLFGIFGKFKALEPLLAGGITEENIGYLIDYVTAECSCLIKDDLPGTDILFDGDWENPKPALVNDIIDANPALGLR